MSDRAPVIEEVAPATELPGVAWAMGWAFLLTQVVGLARRGLTGATAPWPIVSMVLSALVVGWFAAGVLQARPIRTGFVWLILAIAMLLEVIGLFSRADDLGGWIEFLIAAAPVVLLAAFCRSPYFTELRQSGAHAAGVRPAIGGLLALAFITGALGGITAPVSGDGDQVHIGL